MHVMNALPPSFLGGVLGIFRNYYPLLLEGLRYTLILAVFGTLFGLMIAMVLVVMRLLKIESHQSVFTVLFKRTLKRFSILYIGFFRGTPMMVQAMIFYYGLNEMGVRLSFMVAGLIVVSLNTAAYLTEVLRAGVESIDPGQEEAARSLGLTNSQTYRKVLLPQALKNMVPAIGNELVVNIKDTAVLSVIGVGELFYFGRSIAGATYRYTEAFVVVSIIYLVTVMIAVMVLRRVSEWFGKEPKQLLASESEGMV